MDAIPDINRVFLRGKVLEGPKYIPSMAGRPVSELKLEIVSGRGNRQVNTPVVRGWGLAGDIMGEAQAGNIVEVSDGILREVMRKPDTGKRGAFYYIEALHVRVMRQKAPFMEDLNICTLTGSVYRVGRLMVAKGSSMPHLTLSVNINGPDLDDMLSLPLVVWGAKAETIAMQSGGEGFRFSLPDGKVRTRPYLKSRNGKEGVSFEVIAHHLQLPWPESLEETRIGEWEPTEKTMV